MKIQREQWRMKKERLKSSDSERTKEKQKINERKKETKKEKKKERKIH